jgi:hypothetical protein
MFMRNTLSSSLVARFVLTTALTSIAPIATIATVATSATIGLAGCAEADNTLTLCEADASPNPALCNGALRSLDGAVGEGGIHVDADVVFDGGGEVRSTSPASDAGDAGFSGRDGFVAPIDVGVTTCVGAPTPCALAAEICSSVLGCTPTSTCGGVATPCASIFDPSSCSLQSGCFWDSSIGSCNGSESPCTSMPATGCSEQSGCAITSGCGGAALACATIPLSICATQPGCAPE